MESDPWGIFGGGRYREAQGRQEAGENMVPLEGIRMVRHGIVDPVCELLSDIYSLRIQYKLT